MADAPTPAQILEMALAYFASVGIEVTVDDEGLVTDDGRVFGLEPLRRRLADREPGEWVEAVRAHFDTLLSVDPSMPATFQEAASRLRSAVIAESDLGLFDGALMERPLVDGLGERLMVRRGPLGMTVTAETVERWDVAPRLVWERARSGSLWDEPVHTERFRVADGAVRYLAVRGGRWTSTHVLAVGRYLGARHPYGALVAVPARDEILIHQVRDTSLTDAALAMLRHAMTSYVESPLPVGCDLFWWDDGALHRVCTPADGHYRYIRVPAFSAMLWRLDEATAAPRRHD